MPVADGGLPTSAGIVPADASSLSTFLDEYGTGPAFQLTYTDDDIERTRLLHDVSMHAVTLERPSAAPAVQCLPLAPSEDTFTVGVADMEQLSVVEPPPESYTATASTPREEATALRRLAAVHPDEVRVPSLLALLENANAERFVRRDAVRALRRVAFERPMDCTPAVPILRSLLAENEFVARPDAVITMRAIADDDPGAITPAADELVAQLDAANVSVRREAAKCFAAIAEEDPDDAVPGLATIVVDGSDGQEYAVYALSQVSRAYPEAVKPIAETLGETALDDRLDDTVRTNATSALGRVVGEHPSVAVDIVDDVVQLFDAGNHKLRNNAIALVGDVATVHTDIVEPHTDAIVELLTADDDFTRINASGTLSRVAEDFPASVEPATSTFIDSLKDDSAAVRENACWALGHLHAEEAVAALKERVRDDEDPEVCNRAEWALTQLERS